MMVTWSDVLYIFLFPKGGWPSSFIFASRSHVVSSPVSSAFLPHKNRPSSMTAQWGAYEGGKNSIASSKRSNRYTKKAYVYIYGYFNEFLLQYHF
jgi:hypothetical protein